MSSFIHSLFLPHLFFGYIPDSEIISGEGSLSVADFMILETIVLDAVTATCHMFLTPVTSSKLSTEEIFKKLRSILAVIFLNTNKITTFLIYPDTTALGSKDKDRIRSCRDNSGQDAVKKL